MRVMIIGRGSVGRRSPRPCTTAVSKCPSTTVTPRLGATGGYRLHLDDFADGSTDTADVLVGADGTRSRVAASLAGRDLANPIGFGGIAARTPLTARTRALLPNIVNDGPVLALGLEGASVFMQVHDPSGGPAIDPASDGAYRGIPEVIIPFRKPRDGSELPAWKQDYNAGHRKIRARVEHALVRLKTHKILRDYRRAGHTLKVTAAGIAHLHNIALAG
jgi:2-polyprenyl-6-methoxyphenol hydroxylase-like FAD-dependent oxidoreductase